MAKNTVRVPKSYTEEQIEVLKGEEAHTAKSWEALIDYVTMKPRSLYKLWEQYKELKTPPTKRLGTLKAWSVRYNWQLKVIEFDQIGSAAKLEEWTRRAEELNELDWNTGLTFRRLIDKALTTLGQKIVQDSEWSLIFVRATTVFKEVSRIQRLATHEPTEIIGLHGEALANLADRLVEEVNSIRAEAGSEALPAGTGEREEEKSELDTSPQ